ncbi:helix-turn-helix transcriptional regulator [Parafilimonas terrae]|uniref:AraC-type DNA-binding protein n=1 Tax=Parafilimonas terrae TaxID=1465490 RepID=A0A1I5XGL2_9BACT|nr:AraC family transcriptional regulator [Parafilimonas terrae]SFQ31064.1 AraC-type DNA-binding protein [Parafilimonas terrae]
MKFKINVGDFKNLSISNEIPKHLEEYHIPGSYIESYVAAFGSITLQYIKAGDFDFTYCISDAVSEDTLLYISTLNPSLLCFTSLKGTHQAYINSFGDLVFEKSQFNIFYTTTLQADILLKKDYRQIFIIIDYPINFFLYSLKFFPALESLKDQIESLQSVLVASKNLRLNAQCLDLIRKLIHSPFSESTKDFHIEIIKELMTRLLNLVVENGKWINSLQINELESIYTAKEFIDNNLPYHHSISFIARKAGINEQKLKQGFKAIFGMGLYAYYRNEILKIASMELEQTNKSIKQIALHNGYKDANNFSAAFKNKFGMTPKEWRKKKRRY